MVEFNISLEQNVWLLGTEEPCKRPLTYIPKHLETQKLQKYPFWWGMEGSISALNSTPFHFMQKVATKAAAH